MMPTLEFVAGKRPASIVGIAQAVHFFSKPAKSCRALFKNDSRLTFRSRPRDFLQDILNVAYQITRQIPLASADHDGRTNERA